MQKRMGQLSLADGLVSTGNSFLEEADALIDWSLLEKELDGIYGSDTGRHGEESVGGYRLMPEPTKAPG